MLLTRDDRPSEDRLTAILLNGRTGETMDVLYDLGAHSGVLRVIRDGTGFRVLLNRRWLMNQNAGEFAAVDWMLIKEHTGRISHDWENARK
ncbi:MAG: hypothetical protein K2Y28_00965 [Burkholderiaceae bacterium]|nr:hypothetical protein [Burkholderiaceae bacterium]